MANTPNKPRTEDRGTIGQTAQEAAGAIKDKAQEAGRTVAGAASDIASAVREKAGDVAGAVRERASDAASAVQERADTTAGSVGSGMRSLAGTIRDKGPSGGMLGSATSAVASTLESTGRYLEEEGVSGMAEELTRLIRNNPIPALLVGIGLGYLLARATRS